MSNPSSETRDSTAIPNSDFEPDPWSSTIRRIRRRRMIRCLPLPFPAALGTGAPFLESSPRPSRKGKKAESAWRRTLPSMPEVPAQWLRTARKHGDPSARQFIVALTRLLQNCVGYGPFEKERGFALQNPNSYEFGYQRDDDLRRIRLGEIPEWFCNSLRRRRLPMKGFAARQFGRSKRQIAWPVVVRGRCRATTNFDCEDRRRSTLAAGEGYSRITDAGGRTTLTENKVVAAKFQQIESTISVCGLPGVDFEGVGGGSVPKALGTILVTGRSW